LGPHARQFDLDAHGGEDLIGGCVVPVRPDLANRFKGREYWISGGLSSTR
jgi:hypothetical protein